jgi:integrase
MPMSDSPLPPTPPPAPRLLDRVRLAARADRHTDQVAADFVEWTRRFVLFHNKKPPDDLGVRHVGEFLHHVVNTTPDPLPVLDRARRALEFLYHTVLGRDLGELSLPRPPRLLDRMRQVLRVRHYAPATEDAYVQWAERFIRFHGLRHPRDLGAAEVERFLTHLATDRTVAASTQNQALNALVFLYKQVLEIDLGRFAAVRARRGARLPVVLDAAEVGRVLDRVQGAGGVFRIMSGLMYGSGLRVRECCRLRVRDIDLARDLIVVRAAKGDKDRVVMLPRAVRPGLERHLDERRAGHARDVARGVARVDLPAPWTGSTPGRRPRSSGNSCSRPEACRPARGPGGSAGITSAPAPSSGPSRRPGGRPDWTGRSTATRSATASPPTSSSAGWTCGPSRFCWDTRAWKRR